MEKIEALVEVLAKFGNALGNVKVLIGDIEDEVKTHTKSLKLEIENYKRTAAKGESTAKLLSKEEAELRERMSRLRTEIESLDKFKKAEEAKQRLEKSRKAEEEKQRLEKSQKAEEEKALQNSKNHTTNLSVRSLPSIEEENGFSDGLSFDSRTAKVSSYVNKHASVQANGDRDSWWQNADVSDELEEEIDWQKEKAERVQFRTNLMVCEGWRKQNSSFEELEEALRTWTGRLMSWTVVKQGRVTRTGKAMFNVKFSREEDRNKIFALRKEIAEEGMLSIGEALTYVERKERWKMLMMVESLKWTREVEFENKKICVDGEWWKYTFGEGWRKLCERRYSPSLKDAPRGDN